MYLFFDTETTGLPKNWKAPVTDVHNWPRMVQLAWLLYDLEGKELAVGNHIICPEGFSIPAEAAKVHGITTEKAMAEGKELVTVLQEFANKIAEATTLVAHNISFDEKIVGAEFIRKEVDSLLFKKRQICTMRTTTDFCKIPGRYGYKWPSLTELHKILFKTDFEDAHDALADVRACAKCFFELEKQNFFKPTIQRL